jgi:TM2 domain-containing membrane protein YozV
MTVAGFAHARGAAGTQPEVVLLLIVFFILLLLWMLGFLAFPVAGGVVHLLLIMAVVSLILHFSQDRAV